MSKKKISAEDKLSAVRQYLDGEGSQKHIASLYGVSQASFQQWLRNYNSIGAESFTRKGNKKYTKELKEQAVRDYLLEKGSLNEICKKYGIRTKSRLLNWIQMYNGHGELKSSGTGGTTIMTKGRNTTFDERIEIAGYCIAHDHNYAATAEKYGVSYQQARSYTIKYEQCGIEGLRDRRGRRKTESEMSELERLRAENKLLKAEKERAEMEVSFLKKLDEIERRRG